jgi:hypothetical protein
MSSLPALVLNSSSSSIKFSNYEAGDSGRFKLFAGEVDEKLYLHVERLDSVTNGNEMFFQTR